MYINNEKTNDNKGNVKGIMYNNMILEKSNSTVPTSVNSSSYCEKSSYKSPIGKISKFSKYMSKSFGNNKDKTNKKLIHDEFNKNINKQFSSFCVENKYRKHNAFLNYQDKTNSPHKELIIKDDKDITRRFGSTRCDIPLQVEPH